MRLRGRHFKIFALFVCVLILIIALNLLLSHEDKFITLLPSEQEFHEENTELTPNVLINLTNFGYLLPNAICRKFEKGLLAIILVTSYVAHDNLRAAQRQAISQSKLAEMGMQRIFLLGAIPSTDHNITQSQLENEQQRFGDLLQGHFQEAYKNLSYKHVMGLQWAALSCKNAKFIIKMDDDIVLDIFQVRRDLEALEIQQNKVALSDHFLGGFVHTNALPKRLLKNKWYVSKEEYAGHKYPAFLAGWMYITNPPTAYRLALESRKTRIFWIDDVWVTGILRERLKIKNFTLQLNKLWATNREYLECCIRDLKEYNYECEYSIGPSEGRTDLIVDFLHNIEKCYFDECIKREPEKSLKKTCPLPSAQVATASSRLHDGIAIVNSIKLR